jgi:hypothetical protein
MKANESLFAFTYLHLLEFICTEFTLWLYLGLQEDRR